MTEKTMGRTERTRYVKQLACGDCRTIVVRQAAFTRLLSPLPERVAAYHAAGHPRPVPQSG